MRKARVWIHAKSLTEYGTIATVSAGTFWWGEATDEPAREGASHTTTQPSEAVADFEHVQIQAGIVVADAGVGHVLKAITST